VEAESLAAQGDSAFGFLEADLEPKKGKTK
jgi:hypothetical protein